MVTIWAWKPKIVEKNFKMLISLNQSLRQFFFIALRVFQLCWPPVSGQGKTRQQRQGFIVREEAATHTHKHTHSPEK